jgi:periplasmic copper chaperone A
MKKLAIATLLLSTLGAAHAADLEIKDAWVRGTVPAQKATGAFMQLSSKGGVTLVGAASPVAGVVEVHEMAMDGGMMRMRPAGRLAVEPGKPLELKPGSYHIMLMDLKKPLSKGEQVPLTLKVEGKDKKQESVELKAEVRDLAQAQGQMGGGGMDHHHHH